LGLERFDIREKGKGKKIEKDRVIQKNPPEEIIEKFGTPRKGT